MISPRQIAFLALRDIHKGAFADIALDRVLQKNSLHHDGSAERMSDRRLATELVYGCTRRQRTLDSIIDQLAKKPSHQQPKDLRTILHIGLYQLRFAERIPPSAAVNTTVELAKENGFSGLTGFVNGLLRQYLRTADSPSFLSQNLGIRHSFPDWIIEVWQEQFGEEETEKLCIWMNQTPSIDLRINPLRSSLTEVATALKTVGVSCKTLPHLPQGLRLLSHPGAIQKLPGFDTGWWTVQDSSAQLVAHILDPQPGEVIIDACAAPGGKTTHIAELMGDRGKIWACDVTPSRLRKLQENARRLHLESIDICTGDSRNLPQFAHTADRVLLDAPCSGLGTLHRHADARWRQTPESVQELAQLQTELISHTSTFVKPGGMLVYATCTLHPAENIQVVQKFLTTHPDWHIEPVENFIGEMYSTSPGWLQVKPQEQDMDGFFMVRLRKANN
ncbi:16S rRNA (cytosine(967)-C(5))-methyltransferase [Calothrix sp. 336/3]|uniref:16S rRNA (cytosine(967)-C(5))-methyltransferase n=1 Tax=Calothrix sp. 336/3 TaxID=1337936 RepID=UPI0004E39CD8|nr:16S rRNA (cytosine(967)-C(5))-methyltransferase [Calothrix sp. 336/3]AKG23563.1 16S rRNA methyltransferase [Calothrix sp. 336/3]